MQKELEKVMNQERILILLYNQQNLQMIRVGKEGLKRVIQKRKEITQRDRETREAQYDKVNTSKLKQDGLWTGQHLEYKIPEEEVLRQYDALTTLADEYLKEVQ
jgi:hypothetical protein